MGYVSVLVFTNTECFYVLLLTSEKHDLLKKKPKIILLTYYIHLF